MQKKILLSLLVSPVAISAAAQIPVTGITPQGWTSNSVTGGNPFFNEEKNEVICPVGTGSVTQKFKAPAPGKYSIEFTSITNAVISISDGAKIDTKGKLEFTATKEDEEFTVTVAPFDANKEFSFMVGETVIEFEFATENEILTTQFNKLKINTLNGADERDEAKALRTQIADVQKKLDAIDAEIKSVVATDAATDIATYKKFELWADPNKIESEMAALSEELDPLNEAIDTENGLFDNITKNTAAKELATADADKLDVAFKTLTESYNAAEEYTQGVCKEDYGKISDAIAAFKKAIEDTFTEENLLEPDLKFPPEGILSAEEIEKLMTALTGKISTENAKVKAYNDFQTWLSGESTLEKTYTTSRITISGLTSLEAYPGAFEMYKSTQMTDLAKLYNDAKAVAEGVEIGTSQEDIDAATESIEEAVRKMKTLKDETAAKTDGQNILMTSALEVVDGLQKTLNESTEGMDEKTLIGLGVKVDDYAKYEAAVKAVQEAIDSAKAGIEAKYKALELTEGDYDVNAPAIKAVKDAETELNKVKNDLNLDDLKAAQVAIEEATGWLAAFEKDLAEKGEKLEIPAFANIFKGNIDAFEAAIKALNEYNIDNSKIKTAIENATNWAQTIFDALNEAHTQAPKFGDALTTLNGYVASKNLFGTTFDIKAFNEKIGEYQKTASGWTNTYNEIKEACAAENVNGEDIYQKAKELNESISGEGWEEKMTSAFNELENDGSTSNYDFVAGQLKTIAENVDAKVDTTDLQKELDAIKDKLDAQVANNPAWGAEEKSEDGKEVKDLVAEKAAACGAIDTDLETLSAKLKKYTDSQKVYVTLSASLDKVLEAIESAEKYNTDNVSGPKAQEYYTGLIGSTDDAAVDDGKTLADAKTEYSKYNTLVKWLAGYLANGTADDNEETFKEIVSEVVKGVKNLENSMKANETGLSDLLDKSQKTRAALLEALTLLNGEKYDSSLKEVQDAIESINTLLNTNLMSVDTEVADNYNVGKCANAVVKADLTAKYNKIQDDAEAVMNALKDKYSKLVEDANAEIVKESKIEGLVNTAIADYTAAINVYNAYKDLENKGYLAYVEAQPEYTTHEELYQYVNLIKETKAAYEKAVKDANEASTILDAEQFADDYVAKINGYIESINGFKSTIINDYNKWGNEYYAELVGKVQDAINAAHADLVDAGISAEEADEVLSSYNETLETVAALKDKASEVTDEKDYQEMMGYVMDSIADNLDPILKNGIDLSEAALNAWNAKYNTLQETGFDVWDKDLSEIEDFEMLLESNPLLKSYYDDYTQAKADAEQLNKDFNALEANDRLKNLKVSFDTLETAGLDALNAYNSIKRTVERIEKNKELKKTYDGQVDELKDLLKELKSFVNPLAIAQGVNYKSIESNINNLSVLINNYYATENLPSTSIQNDIKRRIDNITTQIDKKYLSVAGEEKAFLEGLVSQAKIAYNNARAANEKETFNDQNTEINELDELVGKLAFDAEKKAEYSKNVLDYEKRLSAVIADLQSKYDPSSLGETDMNSILASLNTLAGEIGVLIANGQDELSGYLKDVQDEYGPKYKALEDELDGIVNDYTAAGSDVIAQQNNYVAALNALKAKVEALSQPMKDAQAKAEKKLINDTRAAELMDQYNDFNKELEDVEATLTEYGVIESYQAQVSTIVTRLERMKTWIETQQEDEKLAADTEYYEDNVYNSIYLNRLIKNLLFYGSKKYAQNLQGEASNEIAKVQSSLNENIDIVPSVKEEIDAKVNVETGTLYAANMDLRVTINGESYTRYYVDVIVDGYVIKGVDEEEYQEVISRLNGYMSDAQGYKAEAERLMTLLENNTYVPGDVDLDPDGLVTSTDILQIVTWVLEKVTLEEIDEELGARVACAANVSGDNKLNITDAVMAINLMLNGNDPEVQSVAMRKLSGFNANAAANDVTMGLMLVGEENGVRRYAITLDNTMPVISGQFDLKLPAGMRIANVTTAERNSNHQVQFSENADGALVVVFSMDNEEFNATSGAVLYIDVEGKGNIQIDEAMVVDTYFGEHIMGGQGTSFVDSIIENAKEAKTRIYNAAGVMFNKLQNGINIIRDSNGKVRKQYNRK